MRASPVSETVSVKIEGLKELEEALLDRSVKHARQGMRAGLESAGEFMRISQARRVPSRSGFLARNIVKKIRLSTKLDEGDVSIGPSRSAYYGQFNEFGSIHNRPPEPFMRPAFEEDGETMVEYFARKLKEALGL